MLAEIREQPQAIAPLIENERERVWTMSKRWHEQQHSRERRPGEFQGDH
jgi:hypothetical protein